jgi:hypothetical protein
VFLLGRLQEGRTTVDEVGRDELSARVLQVRGAALNVGAIRTVQLVDFLWSGRMTPEDIADLHARPGHRARRLRSGAADPRLVVLRGRRRRTLARAGARPRPLPPDTSPTTAMAEYSLDDAVTLLLQLEPEDREDLARVREALAELAFGNRVPIAVQPLVARAVRALRPLAEGTAPDAAAALAEVSALLEQAMGWSESVPGTPAAAPSPRRSTRRSTRRPPLRRPRGTPRCPRRRSTCSPPISTPSCWATSSSRAATASRAARPPCSPSSRRPTTRRR